MSDPCQHCTDGCCPRERKTVYGRDGWWHWHDGAPGRITFCGEPLPMTGDPHSEPLTSWTAKRLAEHLTESVYDVPAIETRAEFLEALTLGLEALVRDVVGPVEKERDERLAQLLYTRDERDSANAALRASEASAEELRRQRDVEHANRLSLQEEGKEAWARAEAAEASAQRLTEALGKIAMLGETPMVGYHNAEAIELARAALDEAQKVKP